MRGWVPAVAGGVLVVGLGVFLAVQGLDRADKVASVLGLFVGLAGLGLTVTGAFGARRGSGGQSVTDSAIGGDVAQVRGVSGSVRIGPAPAAEAPPPPSASSPPAGHGSGDAQSVTRSSAKGPVRQVGDVGGDVEIDR
ncbi:hypothetical protein AB0J83_02190 [Actinoplanes sp. NPDC049596]|uniref:hypothetical protein n=1 Tax=unclassified Actinoplanes TaxID=2626549 RepID=UPI003427AA25